MAEFKPKEGENLYLRLPNRPMNLKVNDIYGTLSKIIKIKAKENKIVNKYRVISIKGETTDFDKKLFFKWFSNKPIQPKKEKKKPLNISTEPTKIKRKKG